MVSYKKLWKLLIDKDMKKQDLIKVAGIAPATLAKMTKGENINIYIIVRICNVLQCTSADVLEIVPDIQGENING